MTEPIVFYDIIGTTKRKAWSGNTWKTRYCLNYKGIPYRTVWVEYPDIASVCEKIGAPPGSTTPGPNPTPLYTLPAIFDPNTNKAVSESMAIARYLDATYPDTPRLVTIETDALHAAFNDMFHAKVLVPLLLLCIVSTHAQLLPRSQAYFRMTREVWLGNSRLEMLSPQGSEKRAVTFAAVEKVFAVLTGWLEADGSDKTFFMGDRISYADITVASFLTWANTVWGEDSEDWKTIMKWNGGRWSKFMDAFKEYMAVDVGTEY